MSVRRYVSKLRAKGAALRRLFYEIPWCVPTWGWRELIVTARAVAGGAVIDGPAIDRFATAVRELLGVAYALPVNRGRTAIEVGLRAMEIGASDDVVMP